MDSPGSNKENFKNYFLASENNMESRNQVKFDDLYIDTNCVDMNANCYSYEGFRSTDKRTQGLLIEACQNYAVIGNENAAKMFTDTDQPKKSLDPTNLYRKNNGVIEYQETAKDKNEPTKFLDPTNLYRKNNGAVESQKAANGQQQHCQQFNDDKDEPRKLLDPTGLYRKNNAVIEHQEAANEIDQPRKSLDPTNLYRKSNVVVEHQEAAKVQSTKFLDPTNLYRKNDAVIEYQEAAKGPMQKYLCRSCSKVYDPKSESVGYLKSKMHRLNFTTRQCQPSVWTIKDLQERSH